MSNDTRLSLRTSVGRSKIERARGRQNSPGNSFFVLLKENHKIRIRWREIEGNSLMIKVILFSSGRRGATQRKLNEEWWWPWLWLYHDVVCCVGGKGNEEWGRRVTMEVGVWSGERDDGCWCCRNELFLGRKATKTRSVAVWGVSRVEVAYSGKKYWL